MTIASNFFRRPEEFLSIVGKSEITDWRMWFTDNLKKPQMGICSLRRSYLPLNSIGRNISLGEVPW